MFEFLFKYPLTLFSKGRFVLLGTWPVWSLFVLTFLVAAIAGFLIWRIRGGRLGTRSIVIWGLQSSTLALLLLLLWQPALSVSSLKPQQNIVAVVVDDSRSMAIQEGGVTREAQAINTLNSGFIKELQKKFQVRLYGLSGRIDRLEKPDQLKPDKPATRIGTNMELLAGESSSLPLGAVVLMSDGADNAGGIGVETISEIRRRRIPIHTVGFGRERFDRDLEVSDVQIPQRALADSRLQAQVTFKQNGLSGKKAKLVVREGAKVLASQDVTLKTDGTLRTESIIFSAGAAGAKNIQVALEPLEGEENTRNNSLTRVVNVEAGRPRVLYIEGEPKWEFKFIRRALEEDRNIHLTTMLRTTQNKVYRQGITNPKELEEGFPSKVEELFAYQGVIVGGVEAGYFTPAQQELLKQFVDRRGGGLLFLGGRAGLTEGGYAKSVFAELLPVTLPDKKLTFFREPATVELTGGGRDSLLCRLEENPDRNVERWKKLPAIADFQEVGAVKPGAVTLAELNAPSRGRLPLLVTQNFGAGRTALLATAGTWRWQMLQPLTDKSHEMFWQQLLRWLVMDTRGRVTSSTPSQMIYDDGRLPIRAKVKDPNFLPASDAKVEAHIIGPDGISAVVDLQPDPLEAGEYATDWNAEKPGSYVVEVHARRGTEDAGRDVFTFRREDGVAEDFHAEQNRELLQKLSEQTGGQYYRPNEMDRLAKEISYSEAGISVRETKDLWNMPIVFLLILLLRAAEWVLRRKWGAV